MATASTKNVEDKRKSKISDADREERLKKAEQYTRNAKPGSLAAKANMVSRYNNSSSDKKDEGK